MAPNNISTERAIGQHDAEIEQLQKDVEKIMNDIHEIKDILSQAKGGWRTLMFVAGISASVGAAFTKFFPWIAK